MAPKCLRAAGCLLAFLFFTSCSPTPASPAETSLYVYRTAPAAFVEFSTDFHPGKEIPFTIPLDCSLLDVQAAPMGAFLTVELSCPNGQTVLFLDTDSGTVSQPVTDSDSHFLAWAGDGKSAYLKVDSLGDTHVVRAYTGGKSSDLDLPGWTYDLSSGPDPNEFIYSFSGGLGQGSELHFAKNKGRADQLLYKDPYNYISFASYSPDGSRIAFLKIPDSQTPFTVGELWIMDADGANPHRLAEADAGHGYAAKWSPDGKWIAFVRRENVQDQGADRSADSLISNIDLVNVETGELRHITSLTSGRVETPYWSPDGNTLAFNTVLDGRMEVQIADITTGEIRSLIPEPACCPAWMRK